MHVLIVPAYAVCLSLTSARCAFPVVWIRVCRSDDFLKVLLYVTKEDRSACGRWLTCGSRGCLSVKRYLSHSSGLLLSPMSMVCCCPSSSSPVLPPCHTDYFFLPLWSTSYLCPVPLCSLSFFPALYRQFLFSKVSFFCFFSSLLPFF